MYSDEQSPEKSEDEKIRENGQKILIIIAAVRIVIPVVNHVIDGNWSSMIVSIAISIALSIGINWVRWFCVISGIMMNLIGLILLPSLIEAGTLAFSTRLLIVLTIADIALLVVLAVSKSVNEFIEWNKSSNRDQYSSRNSMPLNKVGEFENIEGTKPCPFCGEGIVKTAKYCPFCGGNVAEKEDENTRLRREQLESDGLGALFENETDLINAREIRRMYGNGSCISYLNGKAKELGIQDIIISSDDLDSLLSV